MPKRLTLFFQVCCVLVLLVCGDARSANPSDDGNLLPNGGFELGASRDARGPFPAGWWLYDDVGMLWRTSQAQYKWGEQEERPGSKCMGLGPGKYPGLRTFVKLKPGHYRWSFLYRSVNRKRKIAANLFVMTDDVDADNMAGVKAVRDVSADSGKFIKFLMNKVPPTHGQWRRVASPVFQVTRPQTLCIMFEPFFMPDGAWVWFDDVRVTRVSGQELANTPKDAMERTCKVERVAIRTDPDLKLQVFYPDDWKPTDKRAALVICEKSDMSPQREHFRRLGMVVVVAPVRRPPYRSIQKMSVEALRNAIKPRDQVMDIKSAIRYVRKHAARFGIDPNRIAGTGASGGADLIFLAHLNKTMNHPDDDMSVSPSPNALILYCPSFCNSLSPLKEPGTRLVATRAIIERTRKASPDFLTHLTRFVKNTTDEYASPLDRRNDLIKKAAALGREMGIDEAQIKAFQETLALFRKDDMNLLHPVGDALQMRTIGLLTDAPLPPTLIMFGNRDHLYKYQMEFVNEARAKGKEFELTICEGAGHSFLMRGQPFQEVSSQRAQKFLEKLGYLPR